MSQQNYLSIRLENVSICFINVVAFSLSFALEKKSFPEKMSQHFGSQKMVVNIW